MRLSALQLTFKLLVSMDCLKLSQTALSIAPLSIPQLQVFLHHPNAHPSPCGPSSGTKIPTSTLPVPSSVRVLNLNRHTRNHTAYHNTAPDSLASVHQGVYAPPRLHHQGWAEHSLQRLRRMRFALHREREGYSRLNTTMADLERRLVRKLGMQD